MAKLPALPKNRTISACECGCGGSTQSRFVPGHDSKLRGMVLRVRENVMTLDDIADLLGDGCAIATAKAMGTTWERKADDAKTA